MPTTYIAYDAIGKFGTFYAGGTVKDLLINEDLENLTSHTVHPLMSKGTSLFMPYHRRTENTPSERQILANTLRKVASDFEDFADLGIIVALNQNNPSHTENRIDIHAARAVVKFIIADIENNLDFEDTSITLRLRKALRLAKRLLKKYS